MGILPHSLFPINNVFVGRLRGHIIHILVYAGVFYTMPEFHFLGTTRKTMQEFLNCPSLTYLFNLPTLESTVIVWSRAPALYSLVVLLVLVVCCHTSSDMHIFLCLVLLTLPSLVTLSRYTSNSDNCSNSDISANSCYSLIIFWLSSICYLPEVFFHR